MFHTMCTLPALWSHFLPLSTMFMDPHSVLLQEPISLSWDSCVLFAHNALPGLLLAILSGHSCLSLSTGSSRGAFPHQPSPADLQAPARTSPYFVCFENYLPTRLQTPWEQRTCPSQSLLYPQLLEQDRCSLVGKRGGIPRNRNTKHDVNEKFEFSCSHQEVVAL